VRTILAQKPHLFTTSAAWGFKIGLV
jgi:hypothetical protein